MFRVDSWNHRTGEPDILAENIRTLGEAQWATLAAASALLITSRKLERESVPHGYRITRNGEPVYDITYIDPREGWPEEAKR